MRIEKISAQDWAQVSQSAHVVAFSENHDPSKERIDFALLAVDNKATPMAYVTCREVSKDVLYWQFGGAFPGTRNTSNSFKAYAAFAEWTKANYRAVTTAVENTNIVMLKMAFKIGYRVVGLRTHGGQIFLELALEFPKK